MPSVNGKEEEPDATTGLTPSQTRAIRESWALVSAESEQHGVELLMRLFTKEPETRDYFPSFLDKTDSELRTDSNLVSHAVKVMEGVTSLVDNLDNVPILTKTLEDLATDHHRRGIKSHYFELVLTLLQGLLKDGLGDKYDDLTAGAWKQCCQVIHAVVDAAMNKLN